MTVQPVQVQERHVRPEQPLGLGEESRVGGGVVPGDRPATNNHGSCIVVVVEHDSFRPSRRRGGDNGGECGGSGSGHDVFLQTLADNGLQRRTVLAWEDAALKTP